ncbi:FAD-binding oxidoreductase [Nocardia sp. alder85J]|uniref:FAD-binding oxidoreductase n=1 Tax=Nocardia sp. alder85J TaxID=2862949 RepID=UPI001CD6B14C|nr:FAD-binding oxidoreductase [Nocardia sp. alder85J]MCX4095042.1 FAD-binding oxidoreductase [Nocardia sp. alder85J]
MTTTPHSRTGRLDTTGPVFRPGDPGYDEEIRGFQTAYTHRPAVVLGAAHAEDIRLGVEYAARQNLPIAVQATGHGLSVPAAGGLLIGTRRLTGVVVDPVARTARVAAGAPASALIAAAGQYGLAPLNGSSPSVGVIGYHLGGGLGILARTHGYAADHVRALDMVTADGQSRRLEPGDELFAAVLGSGGNFGVVTALELELFPITRVFGGQLTFGTALVEPALEAWRQWTAAVPEELTSAITLMTMPELPMIPEPLRGRYIATIAVAWTGPAAAGEALVAPLRAVGPRLADTLRDMPYAETDSIHRDPDFPHAYTATNALLSELTATATESLLDTAGAEAAIPTVLSLRHLGGALRRPGPAGVAVDHRDAEYLARFITGGEQPGDGLRAHHDALRKILSPWLIGHSPAFLYGAGDWADEAQTRAGYAAATYARLAALKAAYDPGNLFRHNRNIRPR